MINNSEEMGGSPDMANVLKYIVEREDNLGKYSDKNPGGNIMSEKTEKFTEADVYATDENDTMIDEGTFVTCGFLSDLSGTVCPCNTREEHYEHLRNEATLEESREDSL